MAAILFAVYFILVIEILEHLSGADPTEVVLVSRECAYIEGMLLLLIKTSPTSAEPWIFFFRLVCQLNCSLDDQSII